MSLFIAVAWLFGQKPLNPTTQSLHLDSTLFEASTKMTIT